MLSFEKGYYMLLGMLHSGNFRGFFRQGGQDSLAVLPMKSSHLLAPRMPVRKRSLKASMPSLPLILRRLSKNGLNGCR
jgi:hypothetical protein